MKKSIILAIVTLLSLNVSAQSLYDYVIENLAKPLREKKAYVVNDEDTELRYKKSITVIIPLFNMPDCKFDSEGNVVEGDKGLYEEYKKSEENYSYLIRFLEGLRESADESYWWEKRDVDSLHISMAWDREGGVGFKHYSNRDQHLVYGMDYFIVDKRTTPNAKGFTPRCTVIMQYTSFIDDEITGTEFFDDKAYREAVKPVLNAKGIKRQKVKYQFTDEYLENNRDYFLYIFNSEDNSHSNSTITGEIYIVPAETADEVIAKFKEATEAYLSANHQQCYGYQEFYIDRGLSCPLVGRDYRCDENGNYIRMDYSGRKKFDMFCGRLDDGSFTVLLLNTDRKMVVPNDYWLYKSVNNDKKK